MYSRIRWVAACAALSCAFTHAHPEAITRIWLTHGRSDAATLMINWETDTPGPSRVDYGATEALGSSATSDEAATLHHVEVPFPETGALHYRVSTGGRRSAVNAVKSYSGETLRIAAAANWQERPDLAAISADDPHLLVSCGDLFSSRETMERPGDAMNTTPFSRLIDAYPALFARTPFMPALGNHDRQLFVRFGQPPAAPIYDLDATAFRRFFPLPEPGWNWRFDLPAYDLRLIALDLSHTADAGTTWQSCRDFGTDSEQFEWYRETIAASGQRHVITLYNEWHHLVDKLADGAWMPLIRQGSAALSGFGLFAEQADYGGLPCFNTSLKAGEIFGSGARTRFYEKSPGYLLLTFPESGGPMIAEFKGLDGRVMNRTEWPGRG